MVDLENRIAALSPAQREQLRQQLKGTCGENLITAGEPVGPVPLSHAQERLWFLEQLQPGLSAYHLVAQYRLAEPVNLPVLEQALGALIERHPSLRTTFETGNEGRPVQICHDALDWKLAVEDLRHLPESERLAGATRYVEQLTARPFDIARGPLLRITLIRLGDFCMLAIVLHHIIADGWSLGILYRDLMELYQSHGYRRPAVLPELKIGYADFARWQRRTLAGERLQQLLNFWRGILADAPPLLELAPDYTRAPIPSGQGAIRGFAIPGHIGESLLSLGRNRGCTGFMTLLAAWQAFVYGQTGREDVLIGSPVANRNQARTEDLIGLFTNTLVLRTRLDDDANFLSLLDRTRQTVLEAFTHQEMPFAKLVEELQPARNLSYNPLVQVMFSYESGTLPQHGGNPAADKETAASGEEARETLIHCSVKFDLALYIHDDGGCLRGAIEYRTDLYRDDTIAAMVERFRTLLAAIAADPGRKLSQLPTMAADEEDLLRRLNDTEYPCPEYPGFHRMVEEQAQRTPEALAVWDENRRLTYAELDRQANRLAHRLQQLGVEPEVRVGIAVPRSPDTVIALFGVLKAGGGYVALDPEYPAGRLELMQADAGIEVLITVSAVAPRFEDSRARLLVLDEDAELAFCPSTAPPCSADADSLAYMIYTSGSTGRPKGVLLTHRGLCNAADFMRRTFQAGPDTRMVQFFSLCFDGSLFEIATTLTAGGALYAGGGARLLPGPDLVDLLNRENITHLIVPPSILAALPPDSLPGLTDIIVGAEACPPGVVAAWAPGRRLYNGYGPTEATILATLTELKATDDPITIGAPIDNTRIYLLNEKGRQVPPGSPGEIAIAGPGLARGYHNMPVLTAEKFIDCRIGESMRLYKTGDIARVLSNGQLEFLGRRDDQVKVHGVRIEIGEIETLLSRHPDLQSVAVAVTADHQRLIAYYIARPGGAVEGTLLRRYLQQHLPDFMLPSQFVPLAGLPISPSGKVDRQALAQLAPAACRATKVETKGRIEAEVAAIWGEVLAVDDIGGQDNFFDLGGHSLLATQVISRLRETLGVELPVKTLFQAPTVEQFAAAIEDADVQKPDSIGESHRKTGEIDLETLSDEEVESLISQLEG